MEIYLDNRALRQIRLSVPDSIDEGHSENLCDDLVRVFSTEDTEEIERRGGLLIFHDWRQMTSYDTAARVTYLRRMKARKKRYLRHVVAVLPDKPLIRMAVGTSNMVLALTSGGRLQMETEPGPPLVEHHVVRPKESGWR